MLNYTDKSLLDTIADFSDIPEGASYNIRKNGAGVERKTNERVQITNKTDKPGIDITVMSDTVGENIYIPVIITEEGVSDKVYNDFYIGENADVTIIAGCGIHNSGCQESRHDGIHRFFIGKNAKIKYIEKHYGEGEGTGEKILNPETVVYMEEGALCEMESVQIKGVDSTKRNTVATLGKNAKFIVTERLMTHGKQIADSDMTINLDGEGASAQIISRSVAKDDSKQVFYPKAVGNAPCSAHVQCDSIIMDNAGIRSIPEIAANHAEAAIIHEAAIGRINNEQLLKLMTFGLSPEEAEEIIIQGFLS